MARLTLTLFGRFQAQVRGGRPLALSKKAQALLTYLALGPQPGYSRAEMATLLWGNTPDAQARASLRQALAGLRKALGPAAREVLLGDATLALDSRALDADAVTFRRLVAAGSTAALAEAATLYRGDLLQGLAAVEGPFDDWLLAERERFRAQALSALGRLLASHLAAGAREAATDTATRLMAIEPAHEPAHRALMRLYAESGDHAAALRQYQRCIDALQRELGIEPDGETRQVYQDVVRMRAPALPVAADLVETAPFVGRDAELTRIREALARATSAGVEVAAILGEAGIGKTRLLARVAAEAAARGARVIAGHAYASEQIVPCGPWIDALGAAAVTSPDDPARVFDAVVALLDQLAAAQPLVLVLEDLHWADELSLRLLAVVARRLRARRLLVLVTARDDELEDHPALRSLFRDLKRAVPVVTLTLRPFSKSETGALVHAMARAGDVARLAARVWATSAGHPLMVVETVRTLEQGAPVGAPSTQALPERVHEMIAARLERLSEQGRSLVAVAAVIGRAFEFPLFERAVGLEALIAAEGVEELVRRRILRVAGAQFEFTHDRIREVAYDQLLPPRRRVLHRQVGEALEAIHAADPAPHQAALGAHFHAAGVSDKAVRYFRGAGEWALARAAHREAAACFEQALTAASRLPEHGDTGALAIDLRLDFLRPLIRLGALDRVAAHLDEAERLATQRGDLAREGRVNAYRAFIALATGTLGDTRRFAERTRLLGERAGDPALVDVGDLFLGYDAVRVGDYRRASEVLGRLVERMPAVAHLDGYGAQTLPYVGARARLGVALAQLGDFPAAAEHQREAIAFAESVDHRYSVIWGWRERSETALIQGDPDAAVYAERALALTDTWEAFASRPALEAALGWARVLADRVEEGRALLRGALADAEARGITVYQTDLLLRLGEAALLAGDIGEARAFAERALPRTRERSERGAEAWALRLQGEIARQTAPPDVARAEDAYRRALALASELGMRPLVAYCHLGLGELCRAADRSAEGLDHLTTAAALFSAMGMRWKCQSR